LKKNLIIILTLFLLAILSFSAFAHGGGTDGNGGHYNRDTGEYHYHHGHPAHQHEDGERPYDYEEKTSRDGLDILKQLFYSIGFGVGIGMTLAIICGSKSLIRVPDKALIPIFVLTSIIVATISFFIIKW
jgi:uncharacterized membrane protein YedE/YeeE